MKIGILFPGYGSQFVGMSKELYDNSRLVQEYFEEASICLGINFVKLCFASSDSELAKIDNAYPALFLVSSAVAALVKENGIKIDCVAGHGIGEHGALYTAGGLSFPDALYLIKKLAHFYSNIREELDAKSVTIDGISAKKLDLICKENSTAECCAQIAIYENKHAYQVTGHTEAVNAVIESVEDSSSATVEEIDSIEGFHSPLLNDLAAQLKIYLTKIDFKDLQIPLITSTDGKEVLKAKKAQDAIMRQIVKPVYWSNVLKQFASVDLIIVPAPSKHLVSEVKSYYPDKTVIGIDTLADIDILKQSLGITETKIGLYDNI